MTFVQKLVEAWNSGELIGRSRLLAARQAENLQCEKVIEQYKKSLSTWTAADDFGPPAGQLLAVTAALDEVARRIAKRRQHFR